MKAKSKPVPKRNIVRKLDNKTKKMFEREMQIAVLPTPKTW